MTKRNYLIENIALMSEWDWERNRVAGLDPNTLTEGSNKKAYWICSKGHSYHTIIANRTFRAGGCPVCSNKKTVPGINDLATTHPELASEWDYEKNDTLIPQNIVAGSTRRVWWKCQHCGFSWQQSSSQRIQDNNGCPYCSGLRPKKGINDLQTVNPLLASEWNYQRNGSLQPSDVLPQSNKKVWWVCKEGHEWKTSVAVRYKGCRCPVCSGKKILEGINDLQTLYPGIAAEWHRSKNLLLLPTQVSYASQKKVWWQCKYGHEWQSIISNRTNLRSGCPICSNKQVLTGHNDLGTTHPEIAKEWHPEKNLPLRPADIIAGSNKKVWWMCRKGHEWYVAPNQRTQGRNCPVCSEALHTSFPEQCVFYYLTQCVVADNRHTAFGKEIDIYIPSMQVGIEYNGLLYHNGKETADEEKKRFFQKRGIRVITIKESNQNHIDGDVVFYDCNDRKRINLTWVIETVFALLEIPCPTINILDDSLKIHNQYLEFEKKNSIEITHPDLARQWHPTKNGRLVPSMVSSGSNIKVWWQCEQGHGWKADVAHRVAGRGCPYCCNKKVLQGYNDLSTTHPALAAEWNYERNGELRPQDIVAGSSKCVWWKCKNGHEWQAIVYNRKKGKSCPECWKNLGKTDVVGD